MDLIAVAVTTGGDQPQATVDWDPAANMFHLGDEAGSGRWLIRFDTGHHETRVEYAYSLMAADAGIEVPRSRLLVDQKGRAHIISRQVDQASDGKLHVQSMAALRHLDPDQPGAHTYEQAMSTTQSLGVHAPGVAQLYGRMVFNVVAANQNDTTQKVAFTMNPAGQWRLAPAYDVTSAPRPSGHQMTVNDKSADITKQDLQEVGRRFGIRDHARTIEAVISTVAVWDDYAAYAQIPPATRRDIGSTHQLGL